MVTCAGSSPLTRGKRPCIASSHKIYGLIPAHAGKTPGRPRGPTLGSAHPRSRGENTPWIRLAVRSWGSSPLTRGKHRNRVAQRQPRRLIPAHAGKTATDPYSRETLAAHPRSRGENGYDQLAEAAGNGSSPLTRGKRIRAACPPMATGLIPAHAGKTRPEAYDELIRAAHPRSRGENDPITGDLEFKAGSSPLTRGKRHASAVGRDLLRLIPAHAGKTQPPRQASGGCWAHPRSRGENFPPKSRLF